MKELEREKAKVLINICPRESHVFLGVTRLSTSEYNSLCGNSVNFQHVMELVQLVQWNLDVRLLFIVSLRVWLRVYIELSWIWRAIRINSDSNRYISYRVWKFVEVFQFYRERVSEKVVLIREFVTSHPIDLALILLYDPMERNWIELYIVDFRAIYNNGFVIVNLISNINWNI